MTQYNSQGIYREGRFTGLHFDLKEYDPEPSDSLTFTVQDNTTSVPNTSSEGVGVAPSVLSGTSVDISTPIADSDSNAHPPTLLVSSFGEVVIPSSISESSGISPGVLTTEGVDTSVTVPEANSESSSTAGQVGQFLTASVDVPQAGAMSTGFGVGVSSEANIVLKVGTSTSTSDANSAAILTGIDGIENSIGGVDIGAIEGISESRARLDDEWMFIGDEDPVVVEDEAQLMRLSIDIALHPMLYHSNIPMEQMRERVKELTERAWEANAFSYESWVGYLSVENVDIPRSGDSLGLIRGTIDATFLPYPEYEGQEESPEIKLVHE